ncbi:MAG TPA: nucleoside deaminase [Candidatus Saccharimonadales bacterium]|nr:nucleoside deaminase [Candidatus Saccharimonadales bacterium]
MDDLYFMNLAYKQARKALAINEVPIGAVLVDKHGIVLARAYNQVEKKQTQLVHAELVVIAKSCKKKKNWRLSGATLYVTLQPCLMCLGAIYLSRISRIVYGMPSGKFGIPLDQGVQLGIYKNLETKMECMNYEKAKDVLRLFFQKKRKLKHGEQIRIGKN